MSSFSARLEVICRCRPCSRQASEAAGAVSPSALGGLADRLLGTTVELSKIKRHRVAEWRPHTEGGWAHRDLV